MSRHDWRGISTGLRLRPKHHLNILGYLDQIDPDYADMWVNFAYRGMYSRFIVDDKTRLLCMVGNCMAIGESTQARAHMRGAMRLGAKASEVLEVILQSSVNFGMPGMLRGLTIFVKIMAEDGRLDEIGGVCGAGRIAVAALEDALKPRGRVGALPGAAGTTASRGQRPRGSRSRPAPPPT